MAKIWLKYGKIEIIFCSTILNVGGKVYNGANMAVTDNGNDETKRYILMVAYIKLKLTGPNKETESFSIYFFVFLVLFPFKVQRCFTLKCIDKTHLIEILRYFLKLVFCGLLSRVEKHFFSVATDACTALRSVENSLPFYLPSSSCAPIVSGEV